MEIAISEDMYLRPFRYGDEDSLVAMLNNLSTYEWTLRLPYPYTKKDALDRLEYEDSMRREIPFWYGVCLRDGSALEDWPIASLSVMPEENPVLQHIAEIGYCMNPDYRGKGLMTKAVRGFSAFIFRTFPFEKLAAHSFVGNEASAKVLLNAGYKEEGLIRHHYKKNRKPIDSRAFGLLKEEIIHG